MKTAAEYAQKIATRTCCITGKDEVWLADVIHDYAVGSLDTAKKEDFIDWCFTIHLQNTNGRETPEEMFRLGIEAAYEERIQLLTKI